MPTEQRKPRRKLTEKERSLITANECLVRKVAGGMKRRAPNCEIDDLISAGYEGLIEAAKAFDETKGVAFKSFAEFRIRGAMQDDLRLIDPISRDLRISAKRMSKAAEKLAFELGRKPEENEIADEIGVKLHLMRKWRMQLLVQHHVHIDDSEDTTTHITAKEKSPLEAAIQSETRDHLLEVAEQLPKAEQEVIHLAFFGEETLRDIGDMKGITESRVCQIKGSALKNMRKILIKQNSYASTH